MKRFELCSGVLVGVVFCAFSPDAKADFSFTCPTGRYSGFVLPQNEPRQEFSNSFAGLCDIDDSTLLQDSGTGSWGATSFAGVASGLQVTWWIGEGAFHFYGRGYVDAVSEANGGQMPSGLYSSISASAGGQATSAFQFKFTGPQTYRYSLEATVDGGNSTTVSFSLDGTIFRGDGDSETYFKEGSFATTSTRLFSLGGNAVVNTAAAAGVTVAARQVSGESSYTYYLRLTPVPEPTSLSLLVAGLGCVLPLARRRRSNQPSVTA